MKITVHAKTVEEALEAADKLAGKRDMEIIVAQPAAKPAERQPVREAK